MNKAIEVSQLTVNYGQTPILWDLSFTIPTGLLVGVVGPNGAGKTTLLRTLLGLLKPLSGKVSFFDQPLKIARKRIAYVPQRASIDWDFPITVRELVLMGRYGQVGLFRPLRQADLEAADYYLEKVGMSSFAKRQIRQLSGGQQQRAFLARALLQEADVYLMDEPFVGIDQTTRTLLIETMQQLRDGGKTLLIVHHDLHQVETLFDWVLLLNLRLVACGPTQEVFREEMLQKTFGESANLLDEAFKLARQKSEGIE